MSEIFWRILAAIKHQQMRSLKTESSQEEFSNYIKLSSKDITKKLLAQENKASKKTSQYVVPIKEVVNLLTKAPNLLNPIDFAEIADKRISEMQPGSIKSLKKILGQFGKNLPYPIKAKLEDKIEREFFKKLGR